MSIWDFFMLLIIAGVSGWLGRAIAGYGPVGCLGSVALGFIGALIGLLLARELNLPEFFTIDFGDVKFPVVWSVLGAAIFVAILGLIQKRQGR